MICASLMLAVFLGWPLVFGGNGAKGLETAAEARPVAVAALPVPKSKPLGTAMPGAAKPAKPESCYKRYQREIKQCSGNAAAACKLGAADHWDMCEATGFWPD
jgi:hypothetical protein